MTRGRHVATLSQLVDSGWAADERYASKTVMIIGIIVSLFLFCGVSPVHAGENDNHGKTWKTVDELSAEEKAMLDLHVETPRDTQIPYLPLERFPFTSPYTAE